MVTLGDPVPLDQLSFEHIFAFALWLGTDQVQNTKKNEISQKIRIWSRVFHKSRFWPNKSIRHPEIVLTT